HREAVVDLRIPGESHEASDVPRLLEQANNRTVHACGPEPRGDVLEDIRARAPAPEALDDLANGASRALELEPGADQPAPGRIQRHQGSRVLAKREEFGRGASLRKRSLIRERIFMSGSGARRIAQGRPEANLPGRTSCRS